MDSERVIGDKTGTVVPHWCPVPMASGYRIVLTVLGILLCGASPPADDGREPSGSASTGLEKSLADIADSQRAMSQPSGLDKPCARGDDQRSSDLCAQWKAADAARSAADATWLFGAVGTFIGGLTLAAAWSAAKWARKAAEHTREGNEIAKRTFEGQVRPWVKVGAKLLRTVYREGVLRLEVRITCTNIGAIPAVATSLVPLVNTNRAPSPQIFNSSPSLFEGAVVAELHEKTLFPDEEWIYTSFVETTGVPADTDHAALVVAVRYQSPGIYDRYHYTVRVADLGNRKSGSLIVDLREERSLSRLELIERDSFPDYAS
ncbi:MAG: hypothetical protein EOO76_02875 [Novosphingobium sp.]|nr:MAG: hypothetical protein EOO76_02875 [Novosphingobium sp.]